MAISLFPLLFSIGMHYVFVEMSLRRIAIIVRSCSCDHLFVSEFDDIQNILFYG